VPREATLTIHPSVSVVIRAKNEARFIGETLEAIFDPQAVPPRQVVVVDSGSTDGTQAIVESFPTTLIQIRPEEFTYGYALNLGVASVDAEIVATLSAHSLPANPDWLRNLVQPFTRARVAGVYGRQLPRSNATIFELLGMRLTGVLSDTPFDEHVGGAEDIAWVRTMQERGYLIAYQPTAAVYHSHGEPILRHLRRASRDVPTVVGNFLHLGSGGRPVRKPSQADAITRPAPD
jgi:rhamnosyltransferase